ncbi:MAG TPA: hypothetical protein VGT79_02055 [Xanthomonadaceae bacterium]|nr:hypothetical protein [Xanthomonadaceae bacterium]
MKMLHSLLLFLALILISPVGHARFAEAVQSPQQASFVVSGSAAPNIAKVRESIGAAASSRGWQVTSEQPGQLQLRNVIRNKHVVVINVFYDTKVVRAEYVSSENLKYEMRGGVPYIHPKYNEWVSLLLHDIVAKVSS